MKDRKLQLILQLLHFLFFFFNTFSGSCFLFRFNLLSVEVIVWHVVPVMSVKIVHFFLSCTICYLPLKKKIFEWFSLVFVKKWETLQRLHLLPWPWSWIAVIYFIYSSASLYNIQSFWDFQHLIGYSCSKV